MKHIITGPVDLRHVRRWDHIPEAEKVTESQLCYLANEQGRGIEWLEKYLRLIKSPKCNAAIKRSPTLPWMPCSFEPEPDAEFCRVHGGPVRNRTRALRQETIMRMRRDARYLRGKASRSLQRAIALERMADDLERDDEVLTST